MSLNFMKIQKGINFAPQASAPSSPTNGDVYYNSTTNLFQFYQNGSFVGLGSGDVTLAAFGSTPNANGLSLAGQVLNMQPADGTNPGGVSTTTQTFAGNKTFTGTVTGASFIPTSSTVPVNGMYLSTTNTVAFSTATTSAGNIDASQQWTIGAASSSATHMINCLRTRMESPATSTEIYFQFRQAATAKVYVGVEGSGGQLITGSSQSAAIIRTQGFPISFSTDSGASIGFNMAPSNGAITLGVSGSTATHVFNGNLTTTAAVATKSYDTSTPTTGGTVTASANTPGLLMTPAGTLSTLTIKLPSSPIDGQQYWIATSQTITTATWQDAGGTAGNVIGGPSTLTTAGFRFVYSTANTKWYGIG